NALKIEFDRQIKDNALSNYPKNAEFLKLFTKRVITAFKGVFDLAATKFKGNQVSIVNAAVLLPSYAKTRQDEFGTYLEDLLKDEKQHAVVKLYAVKAMREFFPARAWLASNNPNNKA